MIIWKWQIKLIDSVDKMLFWWHVINTLLCYYNGPFQKCNVILRTSLFWLNFIGQDVIYEDVEIAQCVLRGRKLNFWIGSLKYMYLYIWQIFHPKRNSYLPKYKGVVNWQLYFNSILLKFYVIWIINKNTDTGLKQVNFSSIQDYNKFWTLGL